MTDAIKQQLVALLPRLRRFAYSLAGSIDQGDDLVQAACERALARLDQWQPGTRLDSWMFRIMQTVWIDRQRANKVRGIQIPPEDVPDLAGGDPTHDIEQRLTLARTRAAIAQLPEEQRSVLALVTIDGYSYQDAAAILDVPVGTVMSRLARARRRLVALVHGTSDEPVNKVKGEIA